MTQTEKEFQMPKNLSKYGEEAYHTIMGFLKKNDRTFTGGCIAFASPEEWTKRGELYGRTSELIVVHDGGDLAHIFNLDYMDYDLYDAMQKELRKHNLFAEQCTSWYSAIHCC